MAGGPTLWHPVAVRASFHRARSVRRQPGYPLDIGGGAGRQRAGGQPRGGQRVQWLREDCFDGRFGTWFARAGH